MVAAQCHSGRNVGSRDARHEMAASRCSCRARANPLRSGIRHRHPPRRHRRRRGCLLQSIDCTTAARTAYDIGRRTPGDTGIIRIDSLLNATRCTTSVVEQIAGRYPGARGMRQLRDTLELVDGGAESPRETELRLLLVRAGLPRPVTQIPVADNAGRIVRRIDMGWPHWMVGVEYDGEQHFADPTTTPTTSCDWSSSRSAAGRSFESALGSSNTNVGQS